MSNPYNDNFQSGGYFFNPIRRDIAMIQGDTGDIDLTYKDLDIAKRGNFREVFKLPS